MENIVYWIIVGVVAGWFARAVIPGEASGGIVVDFLVGIVGAVAGGYMFNALLGHSYGGLIGSIGVAFVGAVVLLLAVRAMNGGRIAIR